MEDFKEIIQNHFKAYPLMSERDLYKLVFQSAMGPGHAVTDYELTKKWIDFEVKNIEDFEDQNMIETISHESGLIRVNLRPFLKYGGCTDKLCEIFISTANSFSPNTNNIRKLWKQVEGMSRNKIIPIGNNELDSFFLFAESKAFPSSRHSDIYRNSYKPAYRVVSKDIFDSVLTEKKID